MSTVTRGWTTTVPDVLTTNRFAVFVESVVTIVVLWAAVANGLDMTETISSPSLVAMSIHELVVTGVWWTHISATVPRVIYGFVLTLIVGTILGVATGISSFWEKAFQDYVTIGLALPSLFVVIFAAMWFGLSELTPTVAAAAISFPFLTQEVYEGVKDIDNDLLQMASAFGVSRRRSVWRIIVQAVLPQWFGGARYSFSMAWKITTLAELVAAQSGVGFMIGFAMDRLSITDVLAWTITFTALMLVLEYGILRQIEARAFEWRRETTIGWG